jgi:hypothetical protein
VTFCGILFSPLKLKGNVGGERQERHGDNELKRRRWGRKSRGFGAEMQWEVALSHGSYSNY